MARKSIYRYNKNPPLTLIQQKIALDIAYKEAKCTIDKSRVSLTWAGNIRPTPISKEYKVLITYRVLFPPKVWIIGDALEKLGAVDFPHKYEVDINRKMVRICLYRHLEFNSRTYLANTIIPWTVEWLYFYEMWLATGRWLGGGEHPEAGKRKEEDKG